VGVSTAAEDSTVVLRTLPAAALEAADSVEAALDPRSRLVLSLGQYSARHPVTMAAVTGQVTTTTHMPTITATAVVTITVMAAVTMTAMPLAMVSSASREQFSVATTAADISASDDFKKAPDWALFLTSTNESRSFYFHFL
jgi:pyrrolidone-carboxylate peptidase